MVDCSSKKTKSFGGNRRKSIIYRFKWGFLSRTFIEQYNYAHQYSKYRIKLYEVSRKLLWSVERIFKRDHSKLNLNPSNFNILFMTFGGIGESLINANYLYWFGEKISRENIHFDVIDVHQSRIREFLFKPLSKFGSNIFGMENERYCKNYDAIIRIVRYPVVLKCNSDKLSDACGFIQNLFNTWISFEESHRSMILNHPFNDNEGIQECLQLQKKRYQQPDVGELVSISDLDYPLECTSDVLEMYGLGDKLYITINRDTGFGSSSSTKLWPDDRYDELIERIHNKYPNIVLVAVGSSPDSNDSLTRCDLDLRGKTDIGDLSLLVRQSVLHISGEGMSVHLRHVVSKKPSIVIFGSTSSEFYGYPENINVSFSCEIGSCEWKSRSWSEICLINGIKCPPCLDMVSVDLVLSKVDQCLHDGSTSFCQSDSLRLQDSFR